MKMTVIPRVVGEHGTVLKCLEKRLENLEIRERIKTMHITALLRSVRIVRRVQETRGDLLSLRLQRWSEKLARSNVITITIIMIISAWTWLGN